MLSFVEMNTGSMIYSTLMVALLILNVIAEEVFPVGKDYRCGFGSVLVGIITFECIRNPNNDVKSSLMFIALVVVLPSIMRENACLMAHLYGACSGFLMFAVLSSILGSLIIQKQSSCPGTKKFRVNSIWDTPIGRWRER
jgi:biotin transporter BioY